MRKGFTIIELVFVMILIGILSSIAIPKFSGIHNSAIKVSKVVKDRTDETNEALERLP